MRTFMLCAAGLVALIAACATEPEPFVPPLAAGDAALGRAYAEQACAGCHAIGPDANFSPNPAAPSFAALANTPGMSHRALDVWLHSAHPSMPHLMVEPDAIANLSAYLETLQREPSQ